MRARSACIALALLAAGASGVLAASTGRIQGRIVAADTGEPIGFADVVLLPADTTLHPVGGLTNADGTFLLEAPAGHYALQIRALSYARKKVEGIVIEAGQVLPFTTTLASEAIQQEEIVVEAKARQNTEASLLSVRRKAVTVGDAVSAEQVRKSPDKDAAEVLRRVTGLSISDGKYVFVRGLGERYSSTEVDGVRIASPEQNKRVVPLDLVPANLLENITVQKTYTADRPGEFGGGDVQVRTKDFPGGRSFSLTIAQGYAEGVTFHDRATYASTKADVWGFGADARKIPQEVYDVAGNRPLVMSYNPSTGFSRGTLAEVARSFTNVWSPQATYARPDAGMSATYGDEYKLFGRPVGLIASGSYRRTLSQRKESQRFFPSPADTLYDYAVERSVESVQIGALTGVSYRITPAHTVHARAFYTHGADDEVRMYEGPDHNRTEATTGGWLVHRNTRFLYLERTILSGSVEGNHQLPRLAGLNLDWKFSRSEAQRLQPDRRETTYDHRFYDDGSGNLIGYWALGSNGSREYGDLKDNGWGTTASAMVPYALGSLGHGKVVAGYDRQTKERQNFYRRFNFHPNDNADRTAAPESLFSQGSFDGSGSTGYVEEATLNQDNYHAQQKVDAGYLSTDVPLGRRLRATAGVRVEHGSQDVTSYDLFDPGRVTAHGGYANTDWLPSANLTWAMTDAINLRMAASRTLSRPDLNEMSPSPTLEYVGGFLQSGNPDLHRALIDNYDVRFEAFPSLSEVLATGVFYKSLHEPIEQSIIGGAPPVLVPRNSDRGHNVGVELEARAGLQRLWSRFRGLAVNANGSIISSDVQLEPQISKLGSQNHPLQGQADYIANAALSYTTRKGNVDASVMLNATGKRLRALGLYPLPDVYEQPTTSLDATLNFLLLRTRVKLGARNLFDPQIRQLQAGKEISSYRTGRSYTISFNFGS